MLTKLEPCPFCGGNAALLGLRNRTPERLLVQYLIECAKCGAQGPSATVSSAQTMNVEGAVRAAWERWNKSKGPTPKLSDRREKQQRKEKHETKRER